MKNVKTRVYRSRRRQENAEETRRRIMESARKLFVENGYGDTKIEAIAREAGVAAQTVYAGFGSKRGILFELLDDMAVDADLAGLDAELAKERGNPRRQLRARLRFNIRFYAANIELIDLARTVSGVEQDLGAMWAEGEGRRYRAEAAQMAQWEKEGALAPEVSVPEAIDIWWALSSPDVFRLFVVERRWNRERFEAWLADRLELALFGPGNKSNG
jgi:AcrR family transcriptional regulator